MQCDRMEFGCVQFGYARARVAANKNTLTNAKCEKETKRFQESEWKKKGYSFLAWLLDLCTVVCDKQRKTNGKKCIKTHKHTVVSCRFCLNGFSLLHFAFFLFIPQPCYHLDVLIDFSFHSHRLLNRLKSSFKRYSNHVNNKMSILMMVGPI